MDRLREILDSIATSAEFSDIELSDVNQRGIFGNTPLKVAAVRGDVEAARALLNAGADVNAVVEDGCTALHHAAARDHAELIKLLLRRGASPDAVNDDGRTPAGLARLLGVTQAVEILEAHSGQRDD